MYARSFGATRVSVPVIGQGTWHIDSSDRTDAIRALRAGIDAGMTHIDTAEMYGDAEAIVGAVEGASGVGEVAVTGAAAALMGAAVIVAARVAGVVVGDAVAFGFPLSERKSIFNSSPVIVP